MQILFDSCDMDLLVPMVQNSNLGTKAQLDQIVRKVKKAQNGALILVDSGEGSIGVHVGQMKTTLNTLL